MSSLQQAIWESTWIHFSKYKECCVLHLHVNATLCTAAVFSSGRSGVLAGWKSKLDAWETVQHADIPETKSNLLEGFWKDWQIITDDIYKRKSITAHSINPSFLLEKHHIWILFLLKTLGFFFFVIAFHHLIFGLLRIHQVNSTLSLLSCSLLFHSTTSAP